MDEPDLLMQRFVDNELTAEERIRFLRALDQDKALRRRLMDIEGLIAEAGHLPRLAPPEDFRARVCERLPAPRRILGERIRDFLLAPHVLRWNLAGALAVGCLFLAAVWIAERGLLHVSSSAFVETGERRNATVFVRFVLLHPKAGSVSVAGDFNGWNPDRTPLQQAEGGLWTVTIPLNPGRYQYMYVVNGRQWIVDPLATEVSQDGFGAQNAVLDIEAPL